MKFYVIDPWVVTSQNIVFHWLISNEGRIKPRPLLHRLTTGETSKIFFSKTTGQISMKFDVNNPWVVASQNIVFYWLSSNMGEVSPRPLFYIDLLWGKLQDLLLQNYRSDFNEIRCE